MAQLPHHIRLSNTAWRGLIARATKAGYIRGLTARGLGKFMCDLIDANPTPDLWHDTRPDNIKQFDVPALESGHYAMWDTDEVREVRSVLITPEYQRRTADLARAMAIARDSQGMRALTTTSRVSEFWEAFGLLWLTHTFEPSFNYRQKSRSDKYNKVQTELNW